MFTTVRKQLQKTLMQKQVARNINKCLKKMIINQLHPYPNNSTVKATSSGNTGTRQGLGNCPQTYWFWKCVRLYVKTTTATSLQYAQVYLVYNNYSKTTTAAYSIIEIYGDILRLERHLPRILS